MKNILVILADQLRKDTLGCYGNELIDTPNIDKLAADSIVFDRGYVNNPICTPNRLSIFTGMCPRNHGAFTNGLQVEDKGYTLPHYLKRFDYFSASIGKIHFEPSAGSESKESDGYWKNEVDFNGPYWGFDYVEMTLGHHLPKGHYKKWFYDNGGTAEMLEAEIVDELGVLNMPDRLHSSSFVGDRTCEFIKSKGDKPFFLVASFPDPHHPFVPAIS